MTDRPDRVERAFRRHGSFEPAGEGRYEVTTSPFDAEVRAEAGDPPAFAVEVRAPMLSAVVEGEVADVVEDGWLETFERRMEDAHMPLARESVDATVAPAGDQLVVRATLTDPDPARGVDDVGAFVDYVEGTYMEGVIPGYDYGEPVASMREQARQEYDG